MSQSAITDAGFQLELFEDKVERFKEQWRGVFGQEIDLSDESLAGILVDIEATGIQEIDLLAQVLASNLDPDQASGVFLDFVCLFSNTTRLPAVATQVYCSCRGANGTQILVDEIGKRVSMSAGNYEFELVEDAYIDFDNAIECFFEIATIQDSTDYSILIDSTTFTYTSDADATEQEIITGIIDEVNAGALAVTAVQIGTEIRIFSDDFATSFSFASSTANIQITRAGVRALFIATETGPIMVSAGAIDTIVTAVVGWEEVSNLVPGTAGRNRETDDELRLRRTENTTSSQSGTEQGIENALYKNVPNIISASVTSNRTDVTDANGIPPHRLLVIVEGGTDQDVVDALFPASPAGILSYGNTSATHIDSKGVSQTVYFSRVVNLYTWIKIEISVNADYPGSGDDVVKANLVTRGQELAKTGQLLRLQELYCAALAVTGVTNVNSLTAATQIVTSPAPGPGDYSSSNITPDIDQKPYFDVAYIQVTTV